MRCTQYRGLARVTNWVKLKFVAMNLKKPATWKWIDRHLTPDDGKRSRLRENMRDILLHFPFRACLQTKNLLWLDCTSWFFYRLRDA